MTSSYPDNLDVFRRLHNEFDEPTAAAANRLLAGIVALQTELGVDPSNPGAAWPSYTDVSDVLQDLFRIEQGAFSFTTPRSGLWTNGLDVDFASSGRFDDATKLFVWVSYAGGQRLPTWGYLGTDWEQKQAAGYGVNALGAGLLFGDIGGHSEFVNIRTSGSTPVGFTVRTAPMQNSEEGTWEYWYLAMQAP